jgi:hydroxymethylglutaryl-CoA reductase (NADPH)
MIIGAIQRALKYPMETISGVSLLAFGCYLTIVLSNQTTTLPEIVLSAGTSNRQILMKQVIVTLPEAYELIAERGVLSKPVVDALGGLEESLSGLTVIGELGNEMMYKDLCWKQDDECLYLSPFKIFGDKDIDPLDQVDSALTQPNANYLDHCFEGLKKRDSRVVGAKSMVFTLFFNATTPYQQQLVSIWEKRLGGMNLNSFYNHDLSLHFQSITPDGKVAYDVVDNWKQFKRLFQTSHQPDFIMIGVATLLMQATLLNLIMNMRTLGSKFTLAFAVFINSTFAFVLGLVLTRLTGVTLSHLELIQAIPFFVVAIGFEKPFLLTKAIYESVASQGKGSLREKVWSGVQNVGPSIATDYGIESLVLFVSGLFSSSAINRFCVLAGFVVLLDGVLLFSFYMAVLILKLELRRLYLVESAEKEDSKQVVAMPKDLKQKTSKYLARAKLLGILTFLTGHAVTASGRLYSFKSLYDFKPSILEQRDGLVPLSQFLDLNDQLKISIQIARSHILHPTWVPQEMNSVPINNYSIITPESMLVFCSFIAFLAAVVGMKYSPSLKKVQEQKVAEPVPEKKEERVMPRVDSGVDVNDPEMTQLIAQWKSKGIESLSDQDIVKLVDGGQIAPYALEKTLGDYTRAVCIRRILVSRKTKSDLTTSQLPVLHYDYKQVFGVCCENVIGYIPIPVGVAGPMTIDGQVFQIPMATTEGCLVASTSRGCKAISLGGGAKTELTNDGMTRGPVVSLPSVRQSAAMARWIEKEGGFEYLKSEFESTSRFAKLSKIKCGLAGKLLFLRFVTRTGDAMGMNMISKGTEKALAGRMSSRSSPRTISRHANHLYFRKLLYRQETCCN